MILEKKILPKKASWEREKERKKEWMNERKEGRERKREKKEKKRKMFPEIHSAT